MLGGKIKKFKKPILGLLVAILVVINSLVFMATSTAVENNAADVSKIKNTISFDVEKYVNYEIENQKGALIQLNGKAGLTFEEGQTEIPLERIGVRFVVPKIKGSYPESVEVLNGFLKSYDNKTGVVILGGTKEFSLILNYGENAYVKNPEASEIVLQGDLATKLQTDSNNTVNQIVMGKFEQKVKLEEKAGLISSYIEATPLYNGFINRDIDTDYSEKYSVNISQKELGDKITLEINNQIGKNGIKNVSTTFDKANIIDILGENGSVKVLDENNKVIFEINKDTKADEKGLVTVKYEEKVSNVKFELSKPEKVGTIELVNKKQIVANEDNKTATKVEVQNKYTVTKNDKIIYEYVENKDLLISEAKPQVTVETNNNTWINSDINTLEFIVKMPINNNSCSLFNNPVINIKLPEEVAKVIVDEDVLGKTTIVNSNGLTVNTIQYNQDEKTIQIALSGDQKELVQEKDAKETEIRIPVLVKMVNPLTNESTKINVECKNTNIFTNDEEVGTSNLEIKLEDMNKTTAQEKVVNEEINTEEISKEKEEVVTNTEEINEDKQSKKMTLTSKSHPYVRNNFDYTLSIEGKINKNDELVFNFPNYMNVVVFGAYDTTAFETKISDDKTSVTFKALNDIENEKNEINLTTEINNNRLYELAKNINDNYVAAKTVVEYKDNTNNITINSNENIINVGFNKVSVVMESPTEAEKVKKDDIVTYKIKVKNEGKITYSPDGLYFVNVVLYAKTPEEIDGISAKYNNWTIEEKDNNEKIIVKQDELTKDFSTLAYDEFGKEMPNIEIPLTIPYNEEVEVILTGKVNNIVKDTQIKARAMISNKIGVISFNENDESEDNNAQAGFVYREKINNQYSNIVTHRVDSENTITNQNLDTEANNNVSEKEKEETKVDFKVDNYITKVVSKTSNEIIEKEFENNNLSKVKLDSNDLLGEVQKIEYNIVVTNNGNEPGTVEKVIDYIPTGLKLDNLSNINWALNPDGTVENRSLSTKILQPGESEELKLILSKNDNSNDNSINSFNNRVMIQGINNKYNNNDIDEKNNIASSELTQSNGLNIAILTITIIAIIMVVLLVINSKYKIFKSLKFRMFSLIIVAVMIIGGFGNIIVNAVTMTYNSETNIYTTNDGTIKITRQMRLTGSTTDRHRYYKGSSDQIEFIPYYIENNTVVTGTKIEKGKIYMTDTVIVVPTTIVSTMLGDLDFGGIYKKGPNDTDYTFVQQFSNDTTTNDKFYNYVKGLFYQQTINTNGQSVNAVSVKLNSTDSAGNGLTVRGQATRFLYTPCDWRVVADNVRNSNTGLYNRIGYCIDQNTPLSSQPTYDSTATYSYEVAYEKNEGIPTVNYNSPANSYALTTYVFEHGINESLDSVTPGYLYNNNDFYYTSSTNRPSESTTSVTAYDLSTTNTAKVPMSEKNGYAVVGPLKVKANRTGGNLSTSATVTLEDNSTLTGTLCDQNGTASSDIAVTTTEKSFYVRVLKTSLNNKNIKSVKLTGATNEYSTKVIALNGAELVWRDLNNPYVQRFCTHEDIKLQYNTPAPGDDISFDVETIKRTNIKIVKKDTNGNMLKGVGFKIWNVSQAGWVTADSNNQYVRMVEINDFENATTFRTDSNGEVEIKGLAVNNSKYRIVEVDLGENKQLKNLGEFTANTSSGNYTFDGHIMNNDLELDSNSNATIDHNNYGLITLSTENNFTVVATGTNDYKPVKLSGYVWRDIKKGKNQQLRNDLKDADETTIADITVDLLENGVVKTSTTVNNEGYYEFDNIPGKDISKYSVRFTYDGLTYAPVTIKDESAGSKAVENSERRTELNAKGENIENYNEITGNTANNEITADIDKTKINTYYNAVVANTTGNKVEIQNLNLGLYNREMPDVALTMSVTKADMQFLNEDINSNNMNVAFTYAITLINNSSTLTTKVSEINEYFSDKLEFADNKIYDKDGVEIPYTKEEIDEEIANEKLTGYNNYKFTFGNEIVLEPRSSKKLFIKFNLPVDDMQDFINTVLLKTTDIKNYAEIAKYSIYSDIDATTPYLGYDLDSTPNNFKYGNNEDDNDYAEGMKTVELLLRNILKMIANSNQVNNTLNANNDLNNNNSRNLLARNINNVQNQNNNNLNSGENETTGGNSEEQDGDGESPGNQDDEEAASGGQDEETPSQDGTDNEEEPFITISSKPDEYLKNSFDYTINVNSSMKENDEFAIEFPDYMKYSIISNEYNYNNPLNYNYDEDNNRTYYSLNNDNVIEVHISEDKNIVTYKVLKDIQPYKFNITTEIDSNKLLPLVENIEGHIIKAKSTLTYNYANNNESYIIDNETDVSFNKVSVTMESPTANKEIKVGDTVIYKVKVKNEGKYPYPIDGLDYVNVKLLVNTPEELGTITVVYNNWNKEEKTLENNDEQSNENDNEEILEKVYELIEQKNISSEFSAIVKNENEEEIPNVELDLLIPYNETSEILLTGKVENVVENTEIKTRAFVSNQIGEMTYGGASAIIREQVNPVYSEIITHKIIINSQNDNTDDNSSNEIKDEDAKFDFKVENYIVETNVTTDNGTTSKTYNNANLAKLEIKSKEINGAEVKVKYAIKVTNNGETAGSVGRVIDYLPSGMSLDVSSNPNWVLNVDGTVENRSLATKLIKPGESEILYLILNIKMDENSVGTFNNKASIVDVESIYNNEEINILNNTASSELIISIGTGLNVYITITIVIITIMLIIIGIKFGLLKKGKSKFLSLFLIVILVVIGYANINSNAITATMDSNGNITFSRRLWITSRGEKRWRWDDSQSTYRLYCTYYDSSTKKNVVIQGNWINLSPTNYVVITRDGKITVYKDKDHISNRDKLYDQLPFSEKNPNSSLENAALFGTENNIFGNMVCNIWNNQTQSVGFTLNDTTAIEGKPFESPKRVSTRFLYAISDWKVVVDPDLSLVTYNGKSNMYQSVGVCAQRYTSVDGIIDTIDKVDSYAEGSYEDIYNIGNCIKTTNNNYKFTYNSNGSNNDIKGGTPQSSTSGSLSYTLTTDNTNVEIKDLDVDYNSIDDDYIRVGPIKLKGDANGTITSVNLTYGNANNTSSDNTIKVRICKSDGTDWPEHNGVTTTYGSDFYVKIAKRTLGSNVIKSVKFNVDSNTKYTKTTTFKNATITWRDINGNDYQPFETIETLPPATYSKTVSASKTFTVNQDLVKRASLKIVKKDDNGNKLQGVKFILWVVNQAGFVTTDSNNYYSKMVEVSNGYASATRFTTNVNGEVEIKGLPASYTYRIVEVDLGNNHQVNNIGEFTVNLSSGNYTYLGHIMNNELTLASGSKATINHSNYGLITFNDENNISVTVNANNTLKPVSISGYVWNDGKQGKAQKERNNEKDSGDTVLAGIKVELLVDGTVSKTTNTDANGYYSFTNLDAKNIGKYNVRYNYDGLVYAPVNVDNTTTVSPKENTSKATEDPTRRNTLNAKGQNITSHESIKTGNEITAEISASNIQAYYNVISKTSTASTINIPNLNLGLYEREMPDLALVKDIYGADVEFNGAKYTYYFGQGLSKKASDNIEGDTKTITSLGIQVENENSLSENHKYSLPIYESDVKYLDENNNPDLLKVNLTYAIGLVNNSVNLFTSVNEINEYFSKDISLVDNKVYSDSECTTEIGTIVVDNSFNNSDLNKAKITINGNRFIAPNSNMNIYIKYSLPSATFYDFDNHQLYSNINIRNMSEISKYSVVEIKGNSRISYLGYDIDSEPNNFENGINEDDDDIAYGIQIVDAGQRIVKGTVFEDKKIRTETDENGNKISIGNSIFDVGENIIKNVKVNIINVNNPTQKVKVYDKSLKQFQDFEPVTTDENGNYEIKGLIPGNYKLQFIWGNGAVSLGENSTDYVTTSDYNATPWSDENIALHSQEKWYLPKTSQTRYSDAKTEENIDTTPTFTLGIEVDDYSVGENELKKPCVGVYEFLLNNLDFGLIKKPIKTVKLTKRIQHIRMSSEDVLLVDSDIEYDEDGKASFKNDNMKYTKYLSVSTVEPFGTIQSEIDNTLFPIDVEITYEIIASYEDMDSNELSNLKIYDYVDDVLENKNVDNINVASISYNDYNNIVKNLTKIEQAYKDGQVYNNEKINKMFESWTNILSPRASKLSNKRIYELNELEGLLKASEDREQVSTKFKVNGQISNNAEDISLVNDVEAIIVDPTLDNEIPYTSYMDRAQKVVITPQTGENKNYTEIAIIATTLTATLVILAVGIIVVKKK